MHIRQGRSVVALGVLLIAATVFAGSRLYDETYRPQYHFSPARNWINDPNGLVYFEGEYHLFYQYNPYGDLWGHMSWGHAVSRDLLHWTELPVALYEEDGVMMYSGSAVADTRNTSGFGSESSPPLVAIYTARKPDNQSQHIAYSTDRGRTWTKFRGNPVIDIAERNFRDPKVIWHEPTRQWVMIVALAAQKKARFYGSTDLKTWQHLSDFGPAGASTTRNWECPDLFELPVENEPGTSKWVLEVGSGSGTVAGGSGCQYFIGKFDGKTFTNDNPANEALWVDYGRDFYAAQTWSGIPASDGRRIMIGWMTDWKYARNLPTHPWRGQMSLPRVVSLARTAEGIRLVHRPVEELAALRGEHFQANGAVATVNQQLARNSWPDLLEISAVFAPGPATEVGLKIGAGPNQQTVVGYQPGAAEMFVDRTRAGADGFHADFSGRHAAPLSLNRGRVELHVFLDRSSVEAFGTGGRAVITDLIFPDPGTRRLEAYASGGQAKLVSIDVWELKSIWRPAGRGTSD